MSKRVIVIGDVHGQLRALNLLLAAVEWRPEDRLVFLGDLFDRGPQGHETVRFVHSLYRVGHAVVLMGNHEYKAIRWYATNTTPPERQSAAFDAADQEFLQQGLLYYQFSHNDAPHIAVHGGFSEEDWLPPARFPEWSALSSAKRRDAQSLLFRRTDGEASPDWRLSYGGQHGRVIYGHTAYRDFQVQDHSVGVDLGAGNGYDYLGCAVFAAGSPMALVKVEVPPADRVQRGCAK